LTRGYLYDNVDVDSLEVQLRHLLSALVVSAGLTFSMAAHADTVTLNFVITQGGSNGTGSMTLTVTPDAAGGGILDVTAATATFSTPNAPGTTVSATLFPIPGGGPIPFGTTEVDTNAKPFGFFFDDVLLPGDAPFDFAGGLYLTDGTNTYGFFNVNDPETAGGEAFMEFDANGNPVDEPGGGITTANVSFLGLSAVPEPSSLVLCGTGLMAFAGATRRKLFKR